MSLSKRLLLSAVIAAVLVIGVAASMFACGSWNPCL